MSGCVGVAGLSHMRVVREHSHVDNYESVTYLDVLQSCTDEA